MLMHILVHLHLSLTTNQAVKFVELFHYIDAHFHLDLVLQRREPRTGGSDLVIV